MEDSAWEVTDKDTAEKPLWIQAKAYNYTVNVKWDGCVQLNEVDTSGNGLARHVGDLHICNLDDFIKVLQDLKDNIASQVVK